MQDDPLLAITFAQKHAQARAQLAAEMLRLGMLERNGWSIHEFTRQMPGRTELVLRPLHRYLPSPEGMECVVTIDEPGLEIDSNCTLGTAD